MWSAGNYHNISRLERPRISQRSVASTWQKNWAGVRDDDLQRLYGGDGGDLLVIGASRAMRRWASLFPRRYKVRRFDLLVGLCIGYLVNAIVPLRLGELVRCLYVHWRDKVPLAHVAATVVLERLLDIFIVVALLATFMMNRSMSAYDFAATTAPIMLAATLLLSVAVALPRSRALRRTIWSLSSVFNNRIKFALLDFSWTFSTFVNGCVSFMRASLLSLGDVGALHRLLLYVCQRSRSARRGRYLHFARHPAKPRNTAALERIGMERWADAQSSDHRLYRPTNHRGHWLRSSARSAGYLSRHHGHAAFRLCGPDFHTVVSTKRFNQASDYELFLTALFGDEHQLVSHFGVSAIDDAIVYKLLQGGSDAITAVVEANGQLVIRKFAIGAAGQKLKGQALWLEANKAELDLVSIIGEHQEERFFRYDMPYRIGANDYYDVIHLSPIEHSATLLKDIVSQIHIYQANDTGQATGDHLRDYLAKKAIANAETILHFAKAILLDPVYTINGSHYNLASWDRLRDPDWLRNRFSTFGRQRSTATSQSRTSL